MSTLRRILRVIEPHPGEHFKDKIIAVTLAFLVWFAVNAEQTFPQDFQAVPVRLVNLPESLAFAAEVQDTVTVRVNASERDMSRVRATPGLLSPEIDLSNARAGENLFPIDVLAMNVPSGVSVTNVEPAQIRVVLEDREEKFVEVSAVMSGEPAPGFQVAGFSTNPESVLARGPRSIIDALERIDTTIIDVSGRTESFTRTVSLAPVTLVELPRRSSVEMSIEIAELAVNEQFDNVGVVVINNRFQVAVNPQELGVALSGPPSVLGGLDATMIELVIDAAELEPSADDYRIEPTLRFTDPAIGERVQLVALYPQRFINVHVFQQPARQ